MRDPSPSELASVPSPSAGAPTAASSTPALPESDKSELSEGLCAARRLRPHRARNDPREESTSVTSDNGSDENISSPPLFAGALSLAGVLWLYEVAPPEHRRRMHAPRATASAAEKKER